MVPVLRVYYSKNCTGYSPFPKQALVLTWLQYKSFENTVGKGQNAHNKQFLLFPQCFLPFWSTFIKFEIVIGKVFQFERIWNLSFEKGLRNSSTTLEYMYWKFIVHYYCTFNLLFKTSGSLIMELLSSVYQMAEFYPRPKWKQFQTINHKTCIFFKKNTTDYHHFFFSFLHNFYKMPFLGAGWGM